MGIKETVKAIEGSKEHNTSLRMAKGELNLAIMAIDKLREITAQYERLDFGLPEDQLDFWTLADIRTESVSLKLRLLYKLLQGEEDE